jgi:hypothetical protein
MAQGEIDVLDLPFFVLFFIGGLIHNGITSFGEVPVIDFHLADPLFSLGTTYPAEITPAMLLTIGGLGAAIVTNEWGIDGTSAVQFYVVIVTIMLIVLQPFIPLLNEFLLASEGAALVALMIQSYGYISVSYLG